MKKTLLISTLLVGIFSCEYSGPDQNVKPDPIIEEDPDWIRLEIPDGRDAYAIAGDIDGTLLVTTLTKAYITSDQGKTWQESYNFNGPVPGLLQRNDTIFALSSGVEDLSGVATASLALHYTADYGKTWHYYNDKERIRITTGIVSTANGVTYRIKQNRTPTSQGSASYFVNPSGLEKNQGPGFHPMVFPFKRWLKNLHVDGSNRLYVAASGGKYIAEENSIFCCANGTPAIVYISRNPLP